MKTAFSEGARPEGLEPSTYGLEIRCSIRLSYGRRMSTDIYRVSQRMEAAEQSVDFIATHLVAERGLTHRHRLDKR
jgi:hypothetical protein